MTINNKDLILLVLFISILLFVCNCSAANCSFETIYNFGDSMSDTGNLVREHEGAQTNIARAPYGIDAFDAKPTGRCSDGLLMIDYIANSFGLPYLHPYLNKQSNFANGVNFAVAGSTAIDSTMLEKMNITPLFTKSSLNVQLQWFKDHLKSACSTETECKQKLGKSLVMMGEIGGDDFIYAKMSKFPNDLIPRLVLRVVKNIKDAAEEVLNLGATRMVIPGVLPSGCLAAIITVESDTNPESYDDFGCLRSANQLSNSFNDQLKKAIDELKQAHPKATILYGDQYNAFLSVFTNATKFDFDETSRTKACCGAGGENNVDLYNICGGMGTAVCSNPEKMINWDGIHLTQKAYKEMAEWLLNDLTPKLQCGSSGQTGIRRLLK